MLSKETLSIVKSTAPILEEHGETLTRHFYKRMFSHNPEVAPFFNKTNQVTGSQQKALAGAICAYAANIDNLEVLGGAVELIAQKHASLQIKAEHYPIVGENLLASIKEVLGAGATEQVINAWAEAYGLLAKILIGREKQIYTENATMPGGWEGFKLFKVIKKEKESDLITSFYLLPEDKNILPTFKPGQYITIRVAGLNGETTMRNYSLSDKPHQDWFRISVKREVGQDANTPEGYVSNLLHQQVDVGSLLEVAPPCGDFYLDVTEKHERPLVLLAAGIGITPILSMLLSAIHTMPGREIVLIHGCLSPKAQVFKQIIDTLANEHSNLKIHYRYSNVLPSEIKTTNNISTGFIEAKLIESMVPNKNADYYFCGPHAFMVSIYQELLTLGIPANQVHFEFFGPKQELENPKITKCPMGH
jgi:nitric oxide dioxygenase